MGRDARAGKSAEQQALEAQKRILDKKETIMGPVLRWDAHSDGCPCCKTPAEQFVMSVHYGMQPPEDQEICRLPGLHMHVNCPRCQFEWRQIVFCGDEPRIHRLPCSQVGDVLVAAEAAEPLAIVPIK